MSEPKVAGAPYAEVVKTSYTPAGMDGQWRGVIKGNGNVHLTLQILRRGVVESTRYMGHIFLNNKSTIFAYRSVPPKGRDWDWRIFAMAR